MKNTEPDSPAPVARQPCPAAACRPLGPLTGVFALVPLQGPFVQEGLRAEVAAEGPLPRVPPLVDLERVSRAQPLAAGITLERKLVLQHVWQSQ